MQDGIRQFLQSLWKKCSFLFRSGALSFITVFLLFFFFKIFFFDMDHFKVFTEFIIILLLFFMFWFFGCKSWGNLRFTTRNCTHIPWTGWQSLNHWTTREVPLIFFFFLTVSCSKFSFFSPSFLCLFPGTLISQILDISFCLLLFSYVLEFFACFYVLKNDQS